MGGAHSCLATYMYAWRHYVAANIHITYVELFPTVKINISHSTPLDVLVQITGPTVLSIVIIIPRSLSEM